MRKVTFINSRGESIQISRAPFILSRIEGLGEVNANVQTQKAPFQDGSTHIDTLLDERLIYMEVTIEASSSLEVESRMSELARVFNPKNGPGLFVFENDSAKKEIHAAADHVPTFPGGRENRGSSFQRCVIDLIAPNPYWKTPQIEEEPAFEPLFSFSFEGDFEMGMQRDQRIIDNDGEAPAPVQIEFYGPAINPIITNKTTGEYIKVNRTLNEGEYMRIDTTPGEKSVEFVSDDGTVTNVMNWIELGSSFFQLIIGENDIQYSADSDIQGAVVNIYYQKLYTAV